MAKIVFRHLGSVHSIAPGKTHHWRWYNAPGERVWSFSVDPHVPLALAYPKEIVRLEVSRVEYRHLYKGDGEFEREVHFGSRTPGRMQPIT